MVIDKSGKWWTGSTADDIAEYLDSYQAGGYAVDQVVIAACDSCAEQAGFRLRIDGNEGFVERICVACKTATAMLDGAEVAEDAEPEPLRCPCRSREFDVAVGFARREDGEIRWVSIGIRCRKNGALGSPVDWKIDYAPTEHLIHAV